MTNSSSNKPPASAVLSLGELLLLQPAPQPSLIEPGLLPPQGIFFCGGEPKIGKSLLVANLAFCLAAGSSRAGFHVSTRRRVLMCQFELPVDQFTARLTGMRRSVGMAADGHLFVDTRAAGHLLSTPAGLNLSVAPENWAIMADQMGPGRRSRVAPMVLCYTADDVYFNFGMCESMRM